MRALLVVNPWATSTTPRHRDVLVRAFASIVKVDLEETTYRGHAIALAHQAAQEGYDVVAALGGDGTVNEAVNGLLAEGPRAGLPALAVIPGGSANVFARSLGLPNDPIEATSVVLDALHSGSRRVVGLGRAQWHDPSPDAASRLRYFTFCAGMGFDAEVIRAVEGLRSAGCRASAARYVSTAVQRYFMTDRRHPRLTLERPSADPITGIVTAIVSNSAPWTYLGARPVNLNPKASFDTGLDLLALRRLGLVTLLNTLRRAIGEPASPLTGKHLVNLHDAAELTLATQRPMALQVDGDYLGEQERVRFCAIPRALQAVV